MNAESYYKKGAKAIHRHDEGFWHKGWHANIQYDNCVLLSQPRDKNTGRFTNYFYYADEVVVNVKYEDGTIHEALISELEPNRDMWELSREELIDLFGEICRGSIYYSDYQNSHGVDKHTVYDFYEGFWEDIVDRYGEEKASQYDTAEEFAEYVIGVGW